MMMIAFITIKSGLVPLIEGLCPQNYCFRFEIFSGVRSRLLIFFLKENILQNKTVNPRSNFAYRHIHTHSNVYFVHIYGPKFGPPAFFEPSKCLILTPWAHNQVPHLFSVCVCVPRCVRIHTHTPTYTPTRAALKIEKTHWLTTPLFLRLLLSKICPLAKQQVPPLTSWTPPPSFSDAKWTNCTYMSAYVHLVTSVYANVYADAHNF